MNVDFTLTVFCFHVSSRDQGAERPLLGMIWIVGFGGVGSGPVRPIYDRIGWISARPVWDLNNEKRTLPLRAAQGSLRLLRTLPSDYPEGLLFEGGQTEEGPAVTTS